LVTKAALVEQAYALSKYELDQLSKYDAVFGEQQNACFSDRLVPVGKDQKDRVLRHHAKILAAKRGTAKSTISPSPQLVAALRHVYGEGESLVLRSLLQSVMDQPAFAKDEESLADDTSCSGAYQLECLIANVSQSEEDSTLLHGLLISVLSVVTGYEVRDANKALRAESEPESESDPTVVPPLQVGAILSVIKPEEDDKKSWNLDSDLLSYLGQAAAAYEERIEIQKARLLARLDESKKQQQAPQQEHTPSTQLQTLSTPATPVSVASPVPAETPQPAATPESTPDAIAIPEDADAQEDVDASAAALSSAVFEQINAAATGDESSSNDDGDSSDSGSDHDSDYEQSERHRLGNDSSSSSSSSSSGVEPGEDGQQHNLDGDSGEEEDTDDDMVLRQALALSLVEQTQAQRLRVDTSIVAQEEEGLVLPSSLSPGPVTPGNETPLSLREPASLSESGDSPLPSIPPPPKVYPYALLLDTNTNVDSDQIETDSPFFDPAALHRFGTLPAPHVLVHLLRYTLETIERRKFQGREETTTGSRKTPPSTIAGGIGCSLFPPNHPFLKPQKSSNDTGNELAVSVQLLVSLFLLIADRRNDAIANLKKAAAQESRAVQEGDGDEKHADDSGTLTSEERDDPAIALALNYLDEDAPESKESLEAKGMRRKAAAAAHDAAAILKSLRRTTDSLKQRVKLFSHCTILSMKCLRVFLQYVVRRWLQERQGVSAVDCHDFLPRAVVSKLSMGLASLSSTMTHDSFASLLLGNEEDLEDFFMPLRIYQDSLLLWGECVPIMYPSVAAQVDVLRSLLTDCSKCKSQVQYRSLENLTSLPSSDHEYYYHRLQMLCRRLRVSDLLDSFVSSPACYLPESDEDSEVEIQGRMLSSKEPQRASSLITLIGSSSSTFGGIKGELQNLYLALCHRCHVRILLWDGLFACTEPETDEAAVTLTPSPGDTVRVNANPSSSLLFDATKCSDSMAILVNNGEGSITTPNGSSVHQRASKVWGTVLSSTCYSPKTGVHRWAVRLDKCERGHVFVGVSTSQASMRTYVGGDKYGWGMIGTQALWHDRRKIRGDYGATFRTGSTIIVTLDTDAGTLSFSSWKDSSASNSFSLDPIVQNLASPRRHGHVGGTIDEWGVAFEGLPLDSRLYPAVGLYQRDDRVTLLTVESVGRLSNRDSSIDLSGGLCYYPRMTGLDENKSMTTQLNQVRKFNDLLSWDGIEYSIKTLEHIVDRIREGNDDFLWTTLLPTLASALCLVPPSIPVLSERCALTLLPRLTKCITELERCPGDRSMVHRLFRTGLREGKWVIRATGSSGSSSAAEEYVVDFSSTTNENGSAVGFEGTGVGTTGKSKNGLVAIFGTVKGSSVHFVEEWTDGTDEGFSSVSSDDAASSCVVTARLSLDGQKFEGTYRNVQFGTTGQIAGLLSSDDRHVSKFRLKDAPASPKQSAELASAIVAGEALLCLAHSHLATVVGEDAAADHSHALEKPIKSTMSPIEWKSHCVDLKRCLLLPLFSRSSSESNSQALSRHTESLRKLYAPPTENNSRDSVDYLPMLNDGFLQKFVIASGNETDSASLLRETEARVAALDDKVCAVSGGIGSLSTLCHGEYQRARRLLACAFVHHCSIGQALHGNFRDNSVPDELKVLWRAVLKIVEDGVRTAISEKGGLTSREKAAELCQLYQHVSLFLLSLESPIDKATDIDGVEADLSQLFHLITCEEDLNYLREEMVRSTKRALLRLMPIIEIVTLLTDSSGHAGIDSPVAIESLAIGIPRLLGRGYSELSSKQDSQRMVSRKEDLGGHYLSKLPGVPGICRRALQDNVHKLLLTLSWIAGRALLRRKQSIAPESLVSIDSMILSLLASFTTVLHKEDIEFVVLNSELLSVIPEVLRIHRESVLRKSMGADDEIQPSVVKDLHEISRREVSRSVLRAVVAVAHVIIYQALTCKRQAGTATDALSRCLEILLNELSVTLPLVEDALKDASQSYQKKQADGQWEKWCELLTKADRPRTPGSKSKARSHQVGRSGVNYLEEHGISQLSGVQSSAQKPSTRSRGTLNANSKSGTENSIKTQGSFCHQFLSHWMHILVAVSKMPISREIVAQDPRWMKILFGAIGLIVEYDGQSQDIVKVRMEDNPGCLLPGRYRSRILRLMLPLLDSNEPSESIAQSLFCLAGASSLVLSDNLNEDEGMVTREVVSLLRHLHSPTRQSWRSCINRVISTVLDANGDVKEDFARRIGALLFFNGGIEMISRGSYVLLKPAAAVPLSMDQQATPSSKGHSGSSGGAGGGSGIGSTPHHIVGNGTEGVVAGLCRADASAGIVSSIDMKNGVCEVILLNRNSLEPQELSRSAESSLRTKLAFSGSKGSNSSRHTLTVRALRSPLSDVVNAQEVALFVEDSIPVGRLLSATLAEALEIIQKSRFDTELEADAETKEESPMDGANIPGEASTQSEKVQPGLHQTRSEIIEVSYAVMAVRSSITVLADDRILVQFLQQPEAKEILSGILKVAYPEDSSSPGKLDYMKGAQKKFLSSLPVHEARWVHLVSLLRGLISKTNVLKETKDSVWNARLDEFNKRKAEQSTPVTGESSSVGTMDGYRTPPVEPGTVLETPPIFTSVGRSTEGALSRNAESAPNRAVSQSTAGSENSEEDEDIEAAATAAAHLREAAIAQMAELGLPRSWSELALRRTGGTNIEAAVHFCLERGGEMERLLGEERERERMTQRQSSGGSSSRRRGNRDESGGSDHLLRQLMEMGFPSRWCSEALAATGNNVDEALTWILTNGERLSAEDEGMEDGEDDEDVDDDEDEEDSQDDESVDGHAASRIGDSTGKEDNSDAAGAASESKNSGSEEPGSSKEIQGWRGSIIPLRFISGRSIIDPRTLAISGLPTGGFSSVGTKGVLLTSGKWYYEAILETAGCLQIGWADGSFAGHCHADRGDGCGDGPSSWAYDGWRRYRWHATATEWGCRWREGDVIGCSVDMDEHVISFTLNGRGEEIGMGVAFSGIGFRPCGGVYACVSFNRREKLRMILGGTGSEPFKYAPPLGYCGVGEAVLDAAKERDTLVEREAPLDQDLWQGPGTKDSSEQENQSNKRRFLCDFSDGEHGHELMAWAHRYYGSDASVHLGSGRMKQSSGMPKTSSSSTSYDTSTTECLNRRIEQAWTKQNGSSLDQLACDGSPILSKMEEGYFDIGTQIRRQILGECLTISSLLARKLLLHVIVAMGEQFDPECCLSSDSTEEESAVRFWNMIEASASLRSAGWVGEAGAMAIAAEALGLGISSNDSTTSRHAITERSGLASITDLDDGMFVPAGGIVQLLSSVLDWSSESQACSTGSTLAASSEASIGSDGGGGVLIFLSKGLQASICKSEAIRRVILAAIRRSIRLLAVVEYDGEDSVPVDNPNDEDDTERSPSSMEKSSGSKEDENDDNDLSSQPDARLVSFLTGLLLSPQVVEAVDNHDEIKIHLFEAWSVGMLSASLPWRMVCAFTAAGILNSCPRALLSVAESFPTLARFYGRLQSTVARRVWAERAAVPVCSRYSQAMIELLCSVKRSVQCLVFPKEFMRYWNTASVDAATPLPLPSPPEVLNPSEKNWEAEDGWISSDLGWEMWTGTVEFLAVDWKIPSRSAVRTLMDGGDGPPMLREGCTVIRGLDWAEGSKNGNEDGKDLYEAEKAKREAEKRAADEAVGKTTSKANVPDSAGSSDENAGDSSDPIEEGNDPAAHTKSSDDGQGPESTDASSSKKKKKKKKAPSPKLPLGTVLSIEPWNGIPAMARRVRWHLTGDEGVYRYGGDGGGYDISHVEVNDKATRVRKRHPLPESAEQCAARHGFGAARHYSVLLRLRSASVQKVVDGEVEVHRQGIMEWPDFGAGALVDCVLHADGSVTVCEQELVYGSKDSGWEARFGEPSFVPGTVVVLRPTESSGAENQADIDAKSPYQSLYEELLGSSSFSVKNLRNREDGGKLSMTSEMRLFRGRGYSKGNSSIMPASIQAPLPAPIYFDRDYHAPSLSLSRDGRTVSCVSSDGRGTAFAGIGFTKGVHYWEVKLEQADIGSVFIGVAEKPTGSGSGSSYGFDSPPRLNRWHGWGFVNFRATYTAGAERIYGAHCHAGDTVGVLLDCDAGRISFFFDGLKYGEHILNDLGCAFENISPFGFNVDGCGSGGAGQGAPSGIEGGRSGRYPAQGSVRPRALWPVVGLRNHGDRVTMSSKWNSSYGVDGITTVNNAVALDELLQSYSRPFVALAKENSTEPAKFPKWFIDEAFSEYRKWKSNSWCRTVTRGSGPFRLASFGLDLDLDASPLACASASALLGLKYALLTGDRVRLKRSAGRMLELAEEAVVLGSHQGRLYYQIVSQKSEGGSLTEGGGRAWCWDESEVVDASPPIKEPKGLCIELPLMERFKCASSGGLRIVYEGGAVIRSDLEIFEGSLNLGSIPFNSVVPRKDVLERRVNSCGVVRYRVRFEVFEGWISSRIRGGKEEAIVAPVHLVDHENDSEPSFQTPYDCAAEWYKKYEAKLPTPTQPILDDVSLWGNIMDVESFQLLADQGVISGLSAAESDAFLARSVGAISDFCEGGDGLKVSFDQLATAITFALASKSGVTLSQTRGSPGANQVAATAFAALDTIFPPMEAILARVAILRAFNRRAKLALPWLSLRPSQEGAAIFGGIYGHGASIERAGRYWNTESWSQWVQVPTIASKIRSLRGLFFSSVKRGLLQSIAEATTTPTPLSHDEYELPREIRTVRINRLKARRVMSGPDEGAKRKHSVFAQLHNETKGWGGAALRRGFVAKGHGGQKRAFKVKLIGEGVNDYSGPYREAFTDALGETLNVDNQGRGSVGVLDPTANNASEIGENRGLYMFSLNGRDINASTSTKSAHSHEERRIRESFSSLTATRDEASREVEEALVFLGRIMGTAFRHGIPLDLPLPLESVWKAIVEEPSDERKRLQELDTLACRQHIDEDGRSALLCWQQRMLNSFVEGLSNVLPVEVLAILSAEELRDIVCGNPDFDVDLLRRVVEYEGYEETDSVIQYFWDTLREFTNEERRRFLQFVWARNRLPMKESDFDAPFKIQKDSANDNGDQALPSASTCFFSLALPEYSSQEQLKEKLLFAINNVTTMETDFQTNSAEIAEGYRSF
jgi:hypothetical protein